MTEQQRYVVRNNQYEEVINAVIPWYNANGRMGMWFEPMDGPKEIQTLIKYFVKYEEYEKAQDLKEKYEELKEYMVKEEMWKDERNTSK